ncbi:la-related protein 1C-like [Curcuma longa]|uniref:la-related protein 1C-like n=1 Tax=Curcuma longa TaxID=136217 RepID=UPI003D9E5A84
MKRSICPTPREKNARVTEFSPLLCGFSLSLIQSLETCFRNPIRSQSSSCLGVPGSQSCGGAARTPASEMFRPATTESAALPSASAAVGNPPPPPPPPPQESGERPEDASLGRKMTAWKLPTNGASEGVATIGADSWPALAESAAMGRSKPSPSKIPSPSGSIPDPSSSPSLVPAHQKPNPTPSPVKTSAGVSVGSIGMTANAAPATPQRTALKKRNPIGLGVASESSPNDLPQRQGASFVPRNRIVGGHHGRYDGNRKANITANNGGWGSNRGGHGKRQDHDQGGHGWSLPPHTNMLQPVQRGYFMPFIQAPRPVAAPWPPFSSMEAHSQPLVLPVGSNSSCIFHSSSDPCDLLSEAPPVYYVPPPSREALRNAPLIAHQSDHARVMLLKQIEYYFSNENLYKDVFLKKNMDDQGWVPISLIAGFNRVKQLTNDIHLIVDALRDSTLVEIQGEKVRRRNDWMNWMLPSLPKQYAIFPKLQPSATTHINTSTS